MNDGQMHEAIPDDLELLDEAPADEKHGLEDLVAEEAARLAAEQPAPVDPIREIAMAADAAAVQAGRAAGRQVMAQAYEQNRILAIAAIETMIAHAQIALVALKYEPENVPVIAGYLIQADRQLRIASDAVDARLHLADTEERVMAARGETVPSAA